MAEKGLSWTAAEMAILAGGMAIALYYDVRWRRVPNRLVLCLLVLGFALRLAAGGMAGAGLGVVGSLAGAGAFSLPVALRWVGAGDAKLLAAAGMFLGPVPVLRAALFTALAGGFIGLLIIAYMSRGSLLSWSGVRISGAGSTFPYTLAVAGGVVLALLYPAFF
ncbi:MAG: prepilin peptidase [Firmicutes bacterium]|nr:prepilin peptidase [Bacillota bacterium]